MKLKSIALSVALLFSAASANAGLLNIQINNLGGLTTSQSSVFDDAVLAWGEILTGVQSSSDLTLTIDALGVAIDGPNGTLGSAGPTTGVVFADVNFAYALTGIMQFDTADLNALETQGTLFDVIFHEMAHVLGFGTLWNTNSFGGVFSGTQSIYDSGTGQYTGAFALAEYQAEFDPTAMFIPVELDGGPGTADGHWDEGWAGGSSDVMTGFLEGPTSLSRTTIASFADIGFTTSVTHSFNAGEPTAVSAPATLAIFLLGGGLLLLRRKA